MPSNATNSTQHVTQTLYATTTPSAKVGNLMPLLEIRSPTATAIWGQPRNLMMCNCLTLLWRNLIAWLWFWFLEPPQAVDLYSCLAATAIANSKPAQFAGKKLRLSANMCQRWSLAFMLIMLACLNHLLAKKAIIKLSVLTWSSGEAKLVDRLGCANGPGNCHSELCLAKLLDILGTSAWADSKLPELICRTQIVCLFA